VKYKLSNIASRTSLIQELDTDVKYPLLYKPKLKIDGNKEQTISIITMEEPSIITPAIWGILPQNYDDGWKTFQKLKTTLHVTRPELFNTILYKEALLKRRCLIVVTGFYTHNLKNAKVENYLIEKDPVRPFFLAGIYNILEDGFLTCSVINTETNSLLSSVNNLYEYMPLVIPNLLRNHWLNKNTSLEEIEQILSKPYTSKLKINKIAS
jgi:putative SOS response-associated peptidase YedK